MRNRQVPRSEWPSFFRGFSRRHEGWPVTVRVLSGRFGSQVEARELPLKGIVADAAGSGPISIHIGGLLDQHVEHDVPDPSQVWVSENGAEEALDIESLDGTKTILQFRAAAQAETVDGLLHQ